MLALYRLSIFFLLVLLTTPCAYARTHFASIPIDGNVNAAPSNFDLCVIRLMHHWHVPGATIAVMDHGRLIASRSYGWASLQTHQPMQPNNLFRVASVSKTLTAVATLKLVQQHRLHLDDKAFNILNDLKPLNNRPINPNLYSITVRDLLAMSSGWYTEGPGHLDPMFGPWSSHTIKQLGGNIPPSCLAATELMMGRPLQFRPGTQYSYSNLNYCMLGLIISKVTQQNYNPASYVNYVQQQILTPAGITDMRLARTALYNHAPNEVHYYDVPVRTTFNTDGLPYSQSNILEKNYADGGWLASAPDLAKFLQTLAYHRILSPHLMQVMLARPLFQKKAGYYFAMGWTVRDLNHHWYWSKHGSFTGTTAQIMQGNNGVSYVALFNTQPNNKVQFFNQVQRLLITYPIG